MASSTSSGRGDGIDCKNQTSDPIFSESYQIFLSGSAALHRLVSDGIDIYSESQSQESRQELDKRSRPSTQVLSVHVSAYVPNQNYKVHVFHPFYIKYQVINPLAHVKKDPYLHDSRLCKIFQITRMKNPVSVYHIKKPPIIRTRTMMKKKKKAKSISMPL